MPLLSAVKPEFLFYAEVELQFSRETLVKYRDCLKQVQRLIGDKPMDLYCKEDVWSLKSKLLARGLSAGRQVSILSAFKRLMRFCREDRNWPVIDPEMIVIPKRPRREVIFLSPEEISRFLDVIPLETLDGQLCISGIRFRALVETLLGSAMRISEVLSLDRNRIDFERREAKIIGKGNKERIVFFSERAISWMKKYLSIRLDNHPALFVCQGGKSRLKRTDIWRPFSRFRKLARIDKRVTPHLLRHTAATQMLFNGCPVGHIKEILGHERLETTCRYYLGLDHKAAKAAHEQFLIYPELTVAA